MDDYNSNSKKIIIICGFLIIIALIIFGLTRTKKEEFIFYNDDTIKKYEVNEIVPVYIDKEQLAKKYLSEYVNFMLYYPETAYELLEEEEKTTRFIDIEQFKYYINQLKSIKFERAGVKRYSYANYNKKNTYYVVDNSGNTFKFIENSIMDYKVIIN